MFAPFYALYILIAVIGIVVWVVIRRLIVESSQPCSLWFIAP